MSIDTSTLVYFATAIIIAAGSPGPSIATLVARVIVRGWRDVIPFVAAMWVGEVLWFTAAVLGLGILVGKLYWAFLVLKYLGVAYLLFLAWSMWHAPVHITSKEATNVGSSSRLKMFLAGFAITMGNPKIMVFYLALLPNIIDLTVLGVQDWVQLCITLLALLALIDLCYIALANRARQLISRPSSVRIANRISATCMTGAAAGIATR